MLANRLVPFHVARKLYDLGYREKTEYSYPVTKTGTKYKTVPTEPYIHIDISCYDTGTEYRKFLCGSNFDENRLAAPTVWEAQEWLLTEYNTLIDVYSWKSRGDYRNCKWILDINKIPVGYKSDKRELYNTRIEALQRGVQLIVDILVTNLNQ